MDLRSYLSPERVRIELDVSDKWGLMQNMLKAIVRDLPEHIQSVHPYNPWWEALKKREEHETTALGRGIMLPHARIPGLDTLGLCFSVVRPPLAADALDGQPIRIACMILSARESPRTVLEVYSALARLLSHPPTRDKLERCSDAACLYEAIMQHDFAVTSTG